MELLLECATVKPEGKSYNIKILTRVSILQSVDTNQHLGIFRQKANRQPCRAGGKYPYEFTSQAKQAGVPGRAEMSILVYISAGRAWGEGVSIHLGNTDKVSTSQASRQLCQAGRKYWFELTFLPGPPGGGVVALLKQPMRDHFIRSAVCAVYILRKILTRVALLDVDTLKYNLLRFALR